MQDLLASNASAFTLKHPFFTYSAEKVFDSLSGVLEWTGVRRLHMQEYVSSVQVPPQLILTTIVPYGVSPLHNAKKLMSHMFRANKKLALHKAAFLNISPVVQVCQVKQVWQPSRDAILRVSQWRCCT